MKTQSWRCPRGGSRAKRVGPQHAAKWDPTPAEPLRNLLRIKKASIERSITARPEKRAKTWFQPQPVPGLAFASPPHAPGFTKSASKAATTAFGKPQNVSEDLKLTETAALGQGERRHTAVTEEASLHTIYKPQK